MSTTAQTIWDRATQMSSLNDEALVPAPQVVDYISMYERNVFQRAARLNPEYFGTTGVTSTRAAITDVWDLSAAPGGVAAVTRAEIAALIGTPFAGAAVGQQVNLISIRWPNFDVAPRAVLRGRKIFQYLTELGTDPSNIVTQLTVYYSPLPARVTTITQALTVPDEWADLITYPLAKLLAIRDRRTDEETQWLDKAHLELQELFDEAVMVYDFSMKRPIMQVPAVPLSMVPQPASRARPQGQG
jgi:hypothetical protein